MTGFTPDLLFANIVENYHIAKQLYGESLIRLVTGYSTKQLERNIRFPEFQRELKQKLEKLQEELQNERILDHQGDITNKGIELASLTVYSDELDRLSKIAGKGKEKTSNNYGERGHTVSFKKGHRYKDLDFRASIKTAILRGRKQLTSEDLRMSQRESPKGATIVYAIDTSSSMKGEKLGQAKRAGVALAYQAVQNKDKIGLVSFGSQVKTTVEPTYDFHTILHHITAMKASTQTNFAKALEEASNLLGSQKGTKHVLLITDALPTVGKKPKEDTLHAVSAARAQGITISIAGIKLDKEGEELGKHIANIGEGRFYTAKHIQELDIIALEDYYSL